MYLIEILHQTTTPLPLVLFLLGCILSKFYIKPQPWSLLKQQDNRCILSKFYIKPQHVLYSEIRKAGCILSKFYIKPQRTRDRHHFGARCILSKFYIKPQPWRCLHRSWWVVSYRNSTSNHNQWAGPVAETSLYLIEILHQTTTDNCVICLPVSLYLIEILHQTTTPPRARACLLCCILSKFYIKPQPKATHKRARYVVSYRNSTSNHNWSRAGSVKTVVVSYRNSTSNHNTRGSSK